MVLSDLQVTDAGGGGDVVGAIGGPRLHASTTVVIQDDDTLPGTLEWGHGPNENSGVYRVTESAGEVTVTVNRVRGHNGTSAAPPG